MNGIMLPIHERKYLMIPWESINGFGVVPKLESNFNVFFVFKWEKQKDIFSKRQTLGSKTQNMDLLGCF